MGVLVQGGGEGIDRTFSRLIGPPGVRPDFRPAEPAGQGSGRTFGRFFGPKNTVVGIKLDFWPADRPAESPPS